MIEVANRDQEFGNPYAVSFDDVSAVAPDQVGHARNIRAICWLYVFGGLVAFFMAMVLFSGGEHLGALLALVLGAVGTLPAMGVLRKRRWGVPFCQFVSVFYLLWIPIGTVLGFYFLKNIGKVRHTFR